MKTGSLLPIPPLPPAAFLPIVAREPSIGWAVDLRVPIRFGWFRSWQFTAFHAETAVFDPGEFGRSLGGGVAERYLNEMFLSRSYGFAPAGGEDAIEMEMF